MRDFSFCALLFITCAGYVYLVPHHHRVMSSLPCKIHSSLVSWDVLLQVCVCSCLSVSVCSCEVCKFSAVHCASAMKVNARTCACQDRKDADQCMNRAKSEETLVEARSACSCSCGCVCVRLARFMFHRVCLIIFRHFFFFPLFSWDYFFFEPRHTWHTHNPHTAHTPTHCTHPQSAHTPNWR